MLTRLLLLVTAYSLAACQTLVIQPSAPFLVELDDGKDPEPEYLLKKQYTVKIHCNLTASDHSVLNEPTITWSRQNSNDSLDSRYSTVDAVSEDKKNLISTLWIRKPNNEDIVNYTCTGTTKGTKNSNVTAIVQVQSRPLIAFIVANSVGNKVFDVALWPGKGVKILCVADGNPHAPIVFWTKDGNHLSNSSWLNLTDLSYEKDRGFVTCTARNSIGENSAKIYLRVKNPQAYLPPLLIIIGELVIIGIIVVAYELYMRKKRSQNSISEPGEAYKTD